MIKKAWQHQEADSLYVEEVEVGEEAPRQVVSGLVKFIPEAQMQMRRCVLVCNLKPANMRGVKSHAMVLCATSPDGLKVCSAFLGDLRRSVTQQQRSSLTGCVPICMCKHDRMTQVSRQHVYRMQGTCQNSAMQNSAGASAGL